MVFASVALQLCCFTTGIILFDSPFGCFCLVHPCFILTFVIFWDIFFIGLVACDFHSFPLVPLNFFLHFIYKKNW